MGWRPHKLGNARDKLDKLKDRTKGYHIGFTVQLTQVHRLQISRTTVQETGKV